MFKKSAKSEYGPAVNALLEQVEEEGRVTDEERLLIEEMKQEENRNKKYVLRSEYEYRIREVRIHARWEMVLYLGLLLITPLIALTITFYNQRNDRIECERLSSNSIRYLRNTGEELPSNCR